MKMYKLALWINAVVIFAVAAMMLWMFVMHGGSLTYTLDMSNPGHITSHLMQLVFMFYSSLLLVASSLTLKSARLALIMTTLFFIMALIMTLGVATLVGVVTALALLLVSLLGLYSAYQVKED